VRDKPGSDYAMRFYGYDELSDNLILLAIFYRDNGALDKAVSALREAKELCKRHEIEFNGRDLLDDYLQEREECTAAEDHKRRVDRSRRQLKPRRTRP
jgi:hypothetical protein